MEINASRIKAIRQQHQWTQQQLADMCGVSLRTVQRVEKEGNAASETIMSLCAVFEVPREDLLVVPKLDESEWQTIKIGNQFVMIIGAAVSGLVTGATIMYWMLGG